MDERYRVFDDSCGIGVFLMGVRVGMPPTPFWMSYFNTGYVPSLMVHLTLIPPPRAGWRNCVLRRVSPRLAALGW